jgi:predicted acylesterase/phospholipase RssA
VHEQLKPFRVLCIDGGGIRGVIPATVLAELERQIAPQPLASVFDLIVGTSTGGILALGLTVPDKGRPRNTAADLLALYGAESEAIFPGGGPPNWTQRIFGTRRPREWLRNPIDVMNRPAQRLGAPLGGNRRFAGGARYFVAGLEQVLERYFGDALLSAALADVVVTSYDLTRDEPVLFSSRPRPTFISEVPMRVVARATSAGPTYFEPEAFVDASRERALVDGGLYANNPALLGYLLGSQAARVKGNSLVLVSLGTGTRNPTRPRSLTEVKTKNWLAVTRMVMEAAMTGSGVLGDSLLRLLADGQQFQYWRIQTTAGDCNFAMDDSSGHNLECLSARATQLLESRAGDIAAIAQVLQS